MSCRFSLMAKFKAQKIQKTTQFWWSQVTLNISTLSNLWCSLNQQVVEKQGACHMKIQSDWKEANCCMSWIFYESIIINPSTWRLSAFIVQINGNPAIRPGLPNQFGYATAWTTSDLAKFHPAICKKDSTVCSLYSHCIVCYSLDAFAMPGALDADFCMDFNMSSLQRGKDKATKRLQFQCLKATMLPRSCQPLGLLIAGCQDLWGANDIPASMSSSSASKSKVRPPVPRCFMLFCFVGFSVLTLMFSCPFGHSDLSYSRVVEVF